MKSRGRSNPEQLDSVGGERYIIQARISVKHSVSYALLNHDSGKTFISDCSQFRSKKCQPFFKATKPGLGLPAKASKAYIMITQTYTRVR